MKKNNNKKTFWFLGIFIFSALAILAVLSFLAFYDKENPENNFLTINSISSPDTNETSENAEENDDYFLLKNDKNGETIVAIGDNQYLDNTNIISIGASEIISYGENNEQLIYTFLTKNNTKNAKNKRTTTNVLKSENSYLITPKPGKEQLFLKRITQK